MPHQGKSLLVDCDFMEQTLIVSTYSQTIDLLTVTKEELAFVAPFTLKSTRKDCK